MELMDGLLDKLMRVVVGSMGMPSLGGLGFGGDDQDDQDGREDRLDDSASPTERESFTARELREGVIQEVREDRPGGCQGHSAT